MIHSKCLFACLPDRQKFSYEKTLDMWTGGSEDHLFRSLVCYNSLFLSITDRNFVWEGKFFRVLAFCDFLMNEILMNSCP